MLYLAGFKSQKLVAQFISNVIIIFNRKKRERALKNINVALGHSVNSGKIYKKSLYKQVLNTIEFTFIMSKLYKKSKLSKCCNITDLEKLTSYINNKRNVILLSAHAGNFPLMCIYLSLKGLPVSVIYKETNYFGKNTFGNIMNYYGIEAIKYNKNDVSITRQIITSIKRGRLVFFIIDQRGVNKIPAKMFGKEIQVFPGAAIIGKKLDAAIVPVFIHRLDNKHEINILEPFELNTLSINESIQAMISIIETYIRMYPDEWIWSYYKW